MAQITIEYDARNTVAKTIIELIYKVGVFKIKEEKKEESPYNKEFVAKIKRAEKQPSKKIDLEKYGISI